MDLSSEELIPLKTKFKLRDGRMAIFIEEDGEEYRVCGADMGGSYRVDKRGRLYDARESPKDLVAIARPYQPRAGDLVSISGPVIAMYAGSGEDAHIGKFVRELRATLIGPDSSESYSGANYWMFRDNEQQITETTWNYTVDQRCLKLIERAT